ncbi:MAG TPA: FecR domain-containing protein [Hanamia sp.]|nr:FecR domain-containing protein [Hanamia sp.]
MIKTLYMVRPVSRFSYLFKRYIQNTCTAEERNEFVQKVKEEEYILELNSLISNVVNEAETDQEMSQEKADELFDAILNATSDDEVITFSPSKKNKTMWWAAAAIVLLLLGSGIYFILNKDRTAQIVQKEEIHKQQKDDIEPGYNGAILTLSNGQQITLDSAGNGILTAQGNTNIIKKNGKIVYDEQNISKREVLYNTMTTPRGRQYNLVLSDGTKVWLNAASSITFPTAFAGKERKVTITGEAYFEVAHNARQPFQVKVNSINIEVLGTHFNVNSYTDEPYVKTTLLEGSVKIDSRGKTVLLKPKEEARINQFTDEPIAVTKPDIEEVMAWKNGRFSFNKTDLKTVMRQIMRWYNVDVEYKGSIPVRYFTADISRNNNLSAILKILQLSNVHFKMEEDSSLGHSGKITVFP